MKSIKIYIVWLTFLGVIVGCNDELNVDPHTFASDKTYYKTEDQIKSAVNGIYAKVQDLYNDDLYVLTEMRADNTDFQYYPLDRGIQQREDVNDFLMSASNFYNEKIWNMLYDGIQQANIVVEHIGNVDFKDPATKVQYEGEAKFIRAMLYFHLVRLYGSVPLRLKATTGPEDAFSGQRESVENLYTFIMEDTQFAVNSLPEKYTVAGDKGRATSGAALTLMGEIYLTRHDYTNAIATFERVTALGYDLMRGANAYANIFDPKNKNNVESVFEIQYNSSLDGENSSYIFNWGPRDAKLALTGFTGTLAGSNAPTLDIIMAYEPGDQRRDASVAFYVDPKNKEFQESFGKDLSISGDSAVYIKKFYHPPYPINGRANENWPVYRYAYVKLMLADALNEAGRGNDALPYINDVRDRAGLGAINYVDQAQLREAIFHETRVEVAFENHRWYQLLRTGRAIEVMTEHGKAEKARLQEAARKLGQVCHLSDVAYDIKPYKLLFPIPERECRLNGFENNPEWH